MKMQYKKFRESFIDVEKISKAKILLKKFGKNFIFSKNWLQN